MVHFSVALFEMVGAERDLDEMQSMIERLRMQVEKEGGCGSSVQMDRVHSCLRLLKFALGHICGCWARYCRNDSSTDCVGVGAWGYCGSGGGFAGKELGGGGRSRG